MKRIFTFVFAVIIAVAMLGLSVPAEAAKLRIGAHRAIMGSFEVVADKAGFWKKEGLDYTFTSFKQGKLMRNAIIQNNLDTGTTGFSPFSSAISKGAKVTAIGVTANICGTSHVIVAKKFKMEEPWSVKRQSLCN
jgi:ABC-type nitrate/sulfonate/bicarbonate transport system substrate-binding protein